MALSPREGAESDLFGWSVAVAGGGGMVAVGAPYYGEGDTGAVWLYARVGNDVNGTFKF